MFYLIGGHDDLICPACKHTYDVEWDTEYGDPLVGEHAAKCINCGAVIEFGVYYEYTQPNKPLTIALKK